MTTANDAQHGPRLPRKALFAAASILALVVLLLYLEGAFSTKVAPGTVAPQPGVAATGSHVRAEQRQAEDRVEWPATVTSHLVANLAPKVMARVLEVHATVGAPVRKGDVVAVLDDRDIRARWQQASAALRAAEAQSAQAEADLRRSRLLYEKQAATQQDLDMTATRAKSAAAQVAQARDAVAEANVMLGETSLRAPFDGVVAARLADPGDMAVPGKPVIVMHDPASLRLEADVSERCAAPLTVGRSVPVRFATHGADVATTIEEIAPASDPRSRTVMIKVALPPGHEARPGMFATIRLACGSHSAVFVPAAAVKRTGQLEAVRVLVDGEARLRSVRTGKPQDDWVEILSGLQAGETVLVEP
jgi:RND family efflux transporter MFP subunit